MVEYQSGLESVLSNASQSAPTKNITPDIVISEKRDVKIVQLSFFTSASAKLVKQLSLFGISDIPSPSQVKSGKSYMAARVEMEKIWLIGTDMPTKLDKACYPLDLSSARNVLRLSGPRASDVIARLCAVDFRDNSRQFFATSLHHVGVHIHKQKDCFDIYIPRSFGVSLTEQIIEISQQYHVQMA